MTINITVLLNLTPCSLVYWEKIASSICSPEDGGTIFFKSFRKLYGNARFTSQERVFYNVKATIALELKRNVATQRDIVQQYSITHTFSF
jgi:hypothetical protein